MRRQILSDDLIVLGKRLRQVRERAGFAKLKDFQKAIQDRGGKISWQFLGQVERGIKKPTLTTLRMILDSCGVTVPDFLGSDFTVRDDTTVLAARIREVRERAGYKTPGELCKAIQDRGGNITRQYIYLLERAKRAASLNTLTLILDACGMSMDEFLGTNLIIVSRADSNTEERKFVAMLTTIRELNPTQARVIESTIVRAHADALKLKRQGGVSRRDSGTPKSERKRARGKARH